jgi:hypothetical protein
MANIELTSYAQDRTYNCELQFAANLPVFRGILKPHFRVFHMEAAQMGDYEMSPESA